MVNMNMMGALSPQKQNLPSWANNGITEGALQNEPWLLAKHQAMSLQVAYKDFWIISCKRNFLQDLFKQHKTCMVRTSKN